MNKAITQLKIILFIFSFYFPLGKQRKKQNKKETIRSNLKKKNKNQINIAPLNFEISYSYYITNHKKMHFKISLQDYSPGALVP